MSFFFKIILVSFIVLFTTVPSSATTQKKEKEKEVVMDTIHVNGMVLKGKITNLGPEKLSFSLVNIDGNNHIPYKDIDAIHSKHNYTISYGDEKIKGKVVGIVDQKSLKIESAGTTKVVKISEIDRFVMSLENDDSTENRMKHTLPYISGNVHLGLEFDHGAKKQDTINIYMDLLRKKAKHETYFHFDYEFETTEVPDKPKVESEDELAAILGHRYFYDPNNFLYTAILGEFDRPRNIDARYVLDAGYGHKYTFGKGKWIQPWLGLGYVWTRYVENDIYPDKGYTAAALGLNGVYQFNDVKWINRLKLDGEVLYYPSLSNPDEDWLLRSRFGITVPIYEFFSVKLNVKWVNDSNPDPSIGNNKTETDILFGFSF